MDSTESMINTEKRELEDGREEGKRSRGNPPRKSIKTQGRGGHNGDGEDEVESSR